MRTRITRRGFIAGVGAGAAALAFQGPELLTADASGPPQASTTRSDASGMSLLGAYPTQAYFRPDEPGGVRVNVSASAVGRTTVRLRLFGIDGVLLTRRWPVHSRDQAFLFTLPAEPGNGYGIEVSLIDARTHKLAGRSETALDVQTSWVDAPRYGFLSEFAPAEEYGPRANHMLQRHINVVQFYDWMYRHYQYLPPEDIFTDSLGRELSMVSVRDALAEVQSRGMGGMAYGSVYGAEPEYALAHKGQLLYDAPGGNPISLSGLFYLQDVRPGPWRRHILGQYKEAIHRVGFNGIHADQYGFPTEAYDAKGNLVEMGPALAGMVGAAQRAVVADGGEGIIFNCVTNWPIQDVAPEPQLCMYIEVWPPYTGLHDLFSLVRGARDLAPTRQVILAAYMSCAAGHPDAAEAATLLTSAAIHASGGFHLLLGEGTGMLADPYYPNFVRPGASFQKRLVAHWDFIVRYTAYLFDRSLEYRPTGNIHGGGLWAVHRSGPAFDTLSLINASPTDEWNVVKSWPNPRRGVKVEMPSPAQVGAVFAADPDGGATAVRLGFTRSSGKLSFTVPSVRIWTLIIIIHDWAPSKAPGDSRLFGGDLGPSEIDG